MTNEQDRTGLDPIHHVAIAVRDVGAAVAWYTERFRCAIAYRDATWALLRFGNLDVALVTEGEHAAHFGILRRDASAFGEVKTHRDGVRYVYLEDPSGNTVEVVEEKTQPPRLEDTKKG